MDSSPTYTVRAAVPRDLPAIAEIYNDAVLNSTATFDTEPATPEDTEEWLRERGHPYAALVAEHGGDVVGWAAIKAFASKPAYQFTAENAVYVRADMRGKGVGKALLGRLMDVAAENGFRTVIARVAAPNPASEGLHRRFGFRRVGVEQQVGYKLGRWVDVVVMQKLLGE